MTNNHNLQNSHHKKLNFNTFFGFFIQRPIFGWLIVILLAAFGINSYNGMSKEVQPEINIPLAAIITALPGASPSDIESLITEPLEEELSSISDIKTISSNSNFSSSSITIEFEQNVDFDEKINNIKEVVDRAKNDLPQDATDPSVIKFDANDTPIITFSLSSSRPLSELTEVAKNIQTDLKKITGVSEVELIGGQDKQIIVKINQALAEAYGLNIQDISNAIKFSNQNLPAGLVEIDQLNYSIRFDNRFEEISDIGKTILKVANDQNRTPIYLNDVAEIEIGYPEEERKTRFSVNGSPSEQGLSLSISKKENGDIIKIAEAAKLKIEELKTTDLLKDIKISVSNDNSQYIEEELNTLISNGGQTMALIIIILFISIGLKEGILAGLSVPVSFFFAFIVMKLSGMTINSLSLFSLVIALGLMVDTAIVITEGIDDFLNEGYTPKEAALLSVNTYLWPLVAGTLTTVFAFFPMLLVSGIIGQFLRTLPITISAALFGSLLVSLILLPTFGAAFIKARKNKKNTSILKPGFNYLGKLFENLVGKIIQSRFNRVLTILIMLALFVASMMLPISGILKVEMFPKTDANFFIIELELPKGFNLQNTESVVAKVENYLYQIPEVDNFLTIIGSSQSQSSTDIGIAGGGNTESNVANITVNLKKPEEREIASYELTEQLRKQLKDFPEGKITISEISEGPPSAAPINIKITGPDLEELDLISKDISELVSSNNNTQNVRTTFNPGIAEFKFKLDREKVAFHGLSEGQVALIIRNVIQGINSTEIKIQNETLDILVEYKQEKNKTNQLSINQIQNFQIKTPFGYSITLAELGTYQLDESLSSIRRENEKRLVEVRSDVKKQANTVEVTKQIQEKVSTYKLPSSEYQISFGGEADDINESFEDLFKSMIVGVLLIVFTLIIEFNSLKQPFIILLTLPMALIGVFPGLKLIGLNLSFPAFLGVVALAGVVVNDAIVLIDRINENRRNGKEFNAAITESVYARVQPILITTITTIAGILPLALSDEFWGGLGFSLVFGLACATFLTLIIMPVLYYIFEESSDRRQKKQLTKEQD